MIVCNRGNCRRPAGWRVSLELMRWRPRKDSLPVHYPLGLCVCDGCQRALAQEHPIRAVLSPAGWYATVRTFERLGKGQPNEASTCLVFDPLPATLAVLDEFSDEDVARLRQDWDTAMRKVPGSLPAVVPVSEGGGT